MFLPLHLATPSLIHTAIFTLCTVQRKNIYMRKTLTLFPWGIYHKTMPMTTPTATPTNASRGPLNRFHTRFPATTLWYSPLLHAFMLWKNNFHENIFAKLSCSLGNRNTFTEPNVYVKFSWQTLSPCTVSKRFNSIQENCKIKVFARGWKCVSCLPQLPAKYT